MKKERAVVSLYLRLMKRNAMAIKVRALRRAVNWNRVRSLPVLFGSMRQPAFSFKKLPQHARYPTQFLE